MKNKKLIILIICALVIKVGLFAFATIHAPDSKIEIDSNDYLLTAENLAKHGAFTRHYIPEQVTGEIYRTPGYPFFLALFHYILRIPLNGIVFIQVLLTILAAVIVFKATQAIDERLGLLSAAIVLFDPAITARSLMVLTESLYLLFITLFMFAFVSYLKTKKISLLSLSAIILALTTYIRPISYFLGAAISIFIIYAVIRDNKKRLCVAITHAIIFFIIVYASLGIWQYRNIRHANNEIIFSTITNITIESEYASGLFKSYSRNKDRHSKGLPPAAYYLNVTSRCLMSLMTRPASFKYFKSRALTVAGKIFSYPWILFWIAGFLVGLSKMRGNIYYHFFALVILYFIGSTVGGSMWGSGSRFRTPMMPYIAIISAFGWTHISAWFKKLRTKT